MQDDQDWSIAMGLRRALIHQALWSVVCGAAWFGLLHAVAPLIARIGPGRMLIPAAAVGAALGWIMSRNVSEVAGFGGAIVIILVVAFLAAISLGGVALADATLGVPTGTMLYLGGAAFIGGTAAALYVLLTDM